MTFIDAEFVEQHLGALVGVMDLDASDESDELRCVRSRRVRSEGGQQQVMALGGQKAVRPPWLDWGVEQVRGGLD